MSNYWSLDSYRVFIEILKEVGYKFIPFDKREWERQALCHESSLCLLRHDVDADLAAAHDMATIENNLDIHSTYFVMMRSPLYNLFSN